jgi:hypothetical protein
MKEHTSPTVTENISTPKQIELLCQLLESGLTLRLAANMAGVTEATVRRWIAADPELEVQVGAAEARFQLRCIDAILAARDKSGNANVRATMWLLESRFPEQFGRKKATGRAKKKQPDPAPTEEALQPATAEPSSSEAEAAVTIAATPHTNTAPNPTILLPDNPLSPISFSTGTLENILAEVTSTKPQPIRVEPKPQRNTPCPCGSGRKFKHCCGSVTSKSKPHLQPSLSAI